MNKKKVVSLFVVIAVALMGVSLNFSAFAGNTTANPNESIIYLTKANDIKDFKIGKFNQEVKVVKPDTLESAISTDNVNVWVDNDLLNQSKVKEKLNSVFKNGGRIIIKGNELQRNDVRNYFGIDTKDALDIKETPINKPLTEKDEQVIGTKSVGILIYQQDGVNNVTNICGNENDNPEEINKAFLYANQYDYVSLAKLW